MGCRPFHGLAIYLDLDPGAVAPGFMLSSAPQAKIALLVQSRWRAEMRLTISRDKQSFRLRKSILASVHIVPWRVWRRRRWSNNTLMVTSSRKKPCAHL